MTEEQRVANEDWERFYADPAAGNITETERARIQDVLARLLDELSDSYRIQDMYGPHQEIVRAALKVTYPE